MRGVDPVPWGPEELGRYARQILLPEVGGAGQRRIREARVAVVGAGGLGSPAALYLAAAGVGNVTLLDDDRVDLSNLHRQILHGTRDLGQPKTASGREKLAALNPHSRVREERTRLTAGNARTLLADQDLVLDGSDNFDTRYAVNDAAVALATPLVWGAVLRWEGQLMVVRPGTACYRCLFPEPPDPAAARSCAEAGILGPVAGAVGSLMAVEALKVLLGKGRGLENRLLTVEFRDMRVRERPVTRRRGCAACGSVEPAGLH